MPDFLTRLKVLWMANRAYSAARQTGRNTGYIGEYAGVPEIAVFIGIGREAWRVTKNAVEWRFTE